MLDRRLVYLHNKVTGLFLQHELQYNFCTWFLHKAALVHQLLHTSWSDTENNNAEGNSAHCYLYRWSFFSCRWMQEFSNIKFSRLEKVRLYSTCQHTTLGLVYGVVLAQRVLLGSLSLIQDVQLKSGLYFNMSNLYTKVYDMLYYTNNLYLQ